MPRAIAKVVLIAGGAGGQGTVTPELFVREGAAVMLTDIGLGEARRASHRAVADSAFRPKRSLGRQAAPDRKANAAFPPGACGTFRGLSQNRHIIIAAS